MAKILFWVAVVLEMPLIVSYLIVLYIDTKRTEVRGQSTKIEWNGWYEAQGTILLLFIGAAVAKYIF